MYPVQTALLIEQFQDLLHDNTIGQLTHSASSAPAHPILKNSHHHPFTHQAE
jgi:hypothetical protein